MAEAKANRLALVNEDENLSELISKQAVKEMHRSIKEIEKLKEKLLKEFTKKGGKMTEVIDEEMPPSPDKLDLDKAVYGDDAERDPATGDIKKEEVEEGIEDELKKNKGKTWDDAKPAQVAKEKLPTWYKEDEEMADADVEKEEERGVKRK